LNQVKRELRTQLDNGRNQAAQEMDRGITPNPHGLGKEINETIPEEIRKVEQRINEIMKTLKEQ
jgi:hypothetical protein